MVYSLPPLAITGEIITAAWGNDVRDTLEVTAPGIASAAGELFYATAANTIAALDRPTESELQVLGAASGHLPQWIGRSPIDLIERIELTADGDIDFTSISASYAHLRLVISVRSAFTSGDDELRIRFNGSSAANYNYRGIIIDAGNNSEPSGNNENEFKVIHIDGNETGHPSVFSAFIMDITEYTKTDRFTTIRMTGTGNRLNAGNPSVISLSGYWAQTAAVNRITLSAADATDNHLLTGSSATLYGLRG